MRKMIIDLYYGDIRPIETCGAHNRKSKEMARLAEESRNKLLCGLTEEQKQILEKYDEYVGKMNLFMYEDCFAEGYRLGTRMTMEVLSDE